MLYALVVADSFSISQLAVVQWFGVKQLFWEFVHSPSK